MKSFSSAIQKVHKNKLFVPIVIIFLIIIGLFLRLEQISSDLWYDEAFTAIVIKKEWSEMLRVVLQDKVHPPTYYIIIKAWSIIFGETIFSLRAFSMLFGLMLIPLAYLTSTSFFNELTSKKQAGLYSALFFTFSPFFITYSVEARSYTILAFLGMLTLFAYSKYLESTNSNKKRLLLIFFILSAIFTISIHFLGLVFAFFFFLVELYRNKLQKIKNKFYYLILFFIISFFGITLFSQTEIYAKIIVLSQEAWIAPTNFISIFNSLSAFLFGVNRQFVNNPPYLKFNSSIDPINISFLFLIFLIVQIVQFYNNQPKDKDFRLTSLIILTFGPIFLFLSTSFFSVYTYVDRYLIISGCFLFVLTSYILGHMKPIKSLIIIAIYIILTFLIIKPINITRYSSLKSSLEKVSDKTIIYEDAKDYVVMQYYIPQIKKQFIMPPEKIDKYKNWAMVPEEKVLSEADFINLNNFLFIPSSDNGEKMYIYQVD